METTLHQQLKRHYAASTSDVEVRVGAFRIDAVRDDELIEIQCASLSAIRAKATELLRRHRLRIVKPIIVRTRILKSKTKEGKITSRRMSPKRGDVLDIFEELIYFTRVFPHENLTIELPLVTVAQHRLPAAGRRRRRWQKDYRIADVTLESIDDGSELTSPADLLGLLSVGDRAVVTRQTETFDTADLAKRLGKPRWVTQKIAYVLRHCGAIEAHGRTRTGIRYRAA